MDKETAIELAKSKWWIGKDAIVVAFAQLRQPKLCMDFADFHEAVEIALGRPVHTHEFAQPEMLIRELEFRRLPPNITEILAQLPNDQTMILCVSKLSKRSEVKSEST